MRRSSSPTDTVSRLADDALHGPVGEFVAARGKRIRSAMVHLSYSISGGRDDVPTEISQAIEWLHAGSLVIDDVQDGSTQRRGRPTMHRQIGVPLSINAGNFMYFRALEFVTESSLPADVGCRATSELIRVGRVCHEGQAIDLAAQVDQISPTDWADVAETISLQKTGALVELAMRLGAIAASAGQPLLDELGRFGCEVGVALQMRNDLDEIAAVVDEVCSASELTRVDDLNNRRITWPWAWLSMQYEPADCERLAARLRQAVQHGNDAELGRVASELWGRVRELGEREIRRRIEGPVRLLGEHVLDAAALASLRQCLRPIECGNRELQGKTAIDQTPIHHHSHSTVISS